MSEIPVPSEDNQTWPDRENLGPAPTTIGDMIRDLIKYGGSTPSERHRTIDKELRAIYEDKNTEPFIQKYAIGVYSMYERMIWTAGTEPTAVSMPARLRNFSLGARLAVDSVISTAGEEDVQARLFSDVDYWQENPISQLSGADQLEYIYYFEQDLADTLETYDKDTRVALEEFIVGVLGEDADEQEAHDIRHGFCVVGDAVRAAMSDAVE